MSAATPLTRAALEQFPLPPLVDGDKESKGRILILAGSRDGNAIFAIDSETGATTTLVEPGAGGLRAPAGMAFDPDGRLYVSSRETKQILRFDASTGKPDPAPFIDGLEDSPEFIALVDG